jgi:hypothetical protein
MTAGRGEDWSGGNGEKKVGTQTKKTQKNDINSVISGYMTGYSHYYRDMILL